MTTPASAALVLAIAYLFGAIPFSYLFANRLRRVDLREVGTGTVSGTSLYRVAGFPALAAAGILEVAKGAVGPAMAGSHNVLAAIACGAAVAGHDWSIYLRGAGGRGISPALGGLLVVAWPGTVVLLLGLIVGRLLGATAVGSLVAYVALVPVLWLTAGIIGAIAGGAVLVPILLKRLMGNGPMPAGPSSRVLANRLLFDNDLGTRGGDS
jgi:glycerol-3-phosphate acyltransferase PlsY